MLKIDRLLAWFDAHAVGYPLSTQPAFISIAHSSANCAAAARALRTRVPLPAGAAVLTVPRSVCLYAQHAQVIQCAHAQAMRAEAWFDPAATTVNLALQLLIERLKGAESFFAPFLDALVDALTFDNVETAEHPAFWRADEQKWLSFANHTEDDDSLETYLCDSLASTHLDAHLVTKHAVLRKVWRLHVRPFLLARKLISDSDDQEDAQFRMFLWAMYTVWSRGYWVGGEPTLVPVADFFNHGGRGLAQFGSMRDLCESGALSNDDVDRAVSSADGELSAADRAFYCDGAFRVLTWRALAADDEILISYGSLNRELLTDYGFVMEMPLDLDLDADDARRLPNLAAARFSRVTIALCLQYASNGRDVWDDDDDEDDDVDDEDHKSARAPNETWVLACETQLPDSLMRVLRWACWRGDDAFARERLRQKGGGAILSLENERAALRHLDRVLEAMLAIYPELNDAEVRLDLADARARAVRGERFECARRLRRGERALVKHWRDLVRERWMRLLVEEAI